MSHGADYCIACMNDLFLTPENGGCTCIGEKAEMNSIEREQIRRYTNDALALAVEILKAHGTPLARKGEIEEIEKASALQTAKRIFALWENVPEELEMKLRDFKLLMLEIQKIKDRSYGSDD